MDRTVLLSKVKESDSWVKSKLSALTSTAKIDPFKMSVEVIDSSSILVESMTFVPIKLLVRVRVAIEALSKT